MTEVRQERPGCSRWQPLIQDKRVTEVPEAVAYMCVLLSLSAQACPTMHLHSSLHVYLHLVYVGKR